MSCETPKPMYANSLLVYPAKGRGLPTLTCCRVNCGSGSVETCVGTCFAARQPCRAASICGLFFSASVSNSERGVTVPACDDMDSCAKTFPTKTPKNKITQRLRIRAAQDGRAAGFLLASENMFFSCACVTKPRIIGEWPNRVSTETRRRVIGTVEKQKETSRCVSAPSNSGSDQKGSVKGVKLRRRVLRSLKIEARCLGVRRYLW